ncbi:head-tail adaptor [Acinetobacter phage Brutus]|nr:head-tail adaptor [Acinetobacter phage Brutus]
MSLRLAKLANSVITAVNSNTEALLKVSTGFTVTPDGTQVPQYTVQPKVVQAQSMSVEDLKHLGFANQQGQFLSIYADGMIPAIRRAMQKGTSIIVMNPYGEAFPTEWQVKAVLESYCDEIAVEGENNYSGWVKVLIQNTGKESPHDARYFGFAGSDAKPFNQGVFAP